MSARFGGARRGTWSRPAPDTSWVTTEMIRESPRLPAYMRKPSRTTRAARAAILVLALALVAALVVIVALS